jgi:sugar phosphate isomerase/epimerase
LKRRWIVRRLAPDCSRIELAALPKERDEVRLLHAMGFETANVHLGSGSARAIREDLKRRARGWLHKAAQEMAEAVERDWKDWRKAAGGP